MFTITFWKQVLERALKSFIQGSLIIGGFISPDGVWSADALQGAVGLAVASILTSIACAFAGDKDSPSLV